MKRILVPACLLLCSCGGSEGYNSENKPAVVLKFTLSSLPQTLPVNQDRTTDGVDEYAWMVTFDVDDSGTRNAGDIEMGLLYNNSNYTDKTSKELSLGAFQLVVRKVANGGELPAYSIDSYFVQNDGTTLTLTFKRSFAEYFGAVPSNKNVYFKTTGIDSAGDTYYDDYPNGGSFIAIPADGKLTDDGLGEASTGGQAHLDLVSMQILFY